MISLAVAAAALVVALFAGEMLPSTRPPGSSRKLAVPWADAPGGSAACEAFVQRRPVSRRPAHCERPDEGREGATRHF